MSVAIVLPARLASTRLPRKLLLNQTGRTVLEHTVAQALEARSQSAGLIETILVACDDAQLMEAARRAGVEAVMTSPQHPSGTDRIAEVLPRLKEEIVVNLQADEPEIDPARIVQVAALLSGAPPEVEMATLAVPILDEETWRRPSVVKVVMDEQGLALYFSRAPIPHPRDESDSASLLSLKNTRGETRRVYGFHHLGLYAYRREFLKTLTQWPPSRLERLERLEQLRVLEAGRKILVGLAPSHPPGIDTEEDYQAFVKRHQAGAKSSAAGTQDQEGYQADWLDRGATYYGF